MVNYETEINDLTTEYENLEIENNLNYNDQNKILLTFSSCAIEGNTMTFGETENLIKNDITVAGKSFREHLEIKDHYNALVYIYDLARSNSSISVSEIQKINSLVMKNTGSIHNTALGSFDSALGDFRLLNVYSSGTTNFANYQKVPQLIDKFCNYFNSNINNHTTPYDVVRFSSQVHFNFVSIHPFVDGNGRTTRLIQNYIHLIKGIPLVVLMPELRNEYIEALSESRKSKNIKIFLNFMIKNQINYLRLEIDKQKKLNKGKGIFLCF